MNSVFVFFYITALTVNSNFIDTKAETNYKYNSNSMKWSKTAVTMSYVFAILTDTWQNRLEFTPNRDWLDDYIKDVILCFLGVSLSFILLCSMLKDCGVKKPKVQHQREKLKLSVIWKYNYLSKVQNKLPGLESSLCLPNLCASLCRCCNSYNTSGSCSTVVLFITDST